MSPVLRPFRVEGRAIQLAKYLAEERIDDLVRCSCIGNEVSIDLSDTHFLIGLGGPGGTVRLNFQMTHDGPAHARSWNRYLPAGSGPEDIAHRIALDIATLGRELAPLRENPPNPRTALQPRTAPQPRTPQPRKAAQPRTPAQPRTAAPPQPRTAAPPRPRTPPSG
ncbi:hypothetical protein [Kitasatospora sp. NPDC090091]|uniref:hypothetical protein n=1 Tax=Kitasatospora sp. NPDC090091 TaxID=3364081 RepID=UPI0038052956